MSARYYKGREVLKEYKQGRLVYEKSTSIPDYLCFTALEAGQFTLTIPAAVTATYLSYVEWSKDGKTWTHTDNTSEAVTIDVQVAQGEKVYWRGSGNSTAMGVTVGTQNSQFSSSARFDVSGNIMSMLFADDFEGQLVLPNVRYSFTALFRNCNKLVSAENLLLPAMTLRVECYRNLFLSCSNLVKGIKVLPAMQLMQNCYLQMYGACTSLVEGTEIPATTAVSQCCYGMYTGCSSLTIPKPILFTNTASYCCYQMYRFCTSLEVAPDLTQATLADNCFRQMFKGCTKLKYIKCLATNISATQCLLEWCDGVSSTGTFIQAEGVTWPRGASGIPTGWVDVEKRTMPSGYKQVEYVANPNYGYININRALNLNSEKVEIAFVKMASGNSCPLGNPTYNYRYGSLKVINISSALTIRVGVDYDDQVYKQVSISPVTADNPHTFQYVGNSSGFQLYFDGALKSTETCAWDAVSPYQSNLLFSANMNAASSPASFHTNPIYYLKIWDSNNALAVDYVAAIRESDGVAGFYDMAANTFHKSDNANDFTAGEEI